MNPTIETIKKGQEEFEKADLYDEQFGCDSSDCCNACCQDTVSLVKVQKWHTSFLISLFEGEVKRLKEQKYKCTQELLDEIREQKIKNRQTQTMFISHGLIEATRLQIKHYQEIIDYLKSIV